MLKPGGYAQIMAPDPTVVNFDRLRRAKIPAGTFEADVFTCHHCNHVVHVKPGAIPDELGSMCRSCMKMVCPACAPKGCTPWEKQLEAWEARDRALRSYGM